MLPGISLCCHPSSASHPELPAFILKIETSFEEWVKLLLRGEMGDALRDRDEVDQQYCIVNVRNHIRRVQSAIGCGPVTMRGGEANTAEPHTLCLDDESQVERLASKAE